MGNNYHFSSSSLLVVAFSGGPDSVYAVENLSHNGFKNLILAHFHHHIRNEEAEKDAIFCEQYAQKNGYRWARGDWETPENSEEKARKARYTFLEKIREESEAKAIVTGHHADDMAETIFLQFLRGGGMRGLKGMEEWDDIRKIWRPFLGVQKCEIVQFLQDKKIPFCIDSSNNESIFTRNFLRNKIFPLLQDRFPGFSQRILKNTEYIASTVSFLESVAEEFLAFYPSPYFEKDHFFSLHPTVRYEVLRKICSPFFGDSLPIEQIEEFLKNGKSGKKWQGKGKIFTIFGKNVFYESI